MVITNKSTALRVKLSIFQRTYYVRFLPSRNALMNPFPSLEYRVKPSMTHETNTLAGDKFWRVHRARWHYIKTQSLLMVQFSCVSRVAKALRDVYRDVATYFQYVGTMWRAENTWWSLHSASQRSPETLKNRHFDCHKIPISICIWPCLRRTL